MSKFRIGRTATSLILLHAGGATTQSGAASLNGVLRQVIIAAPAVVDASATLTIDILDSDSNIIWTKASVAANTKSNTLLTQDQTVPLSGTQTIRVTFSAAQTVTDTTTIVTLLVDHGA